MIAGTQKGGSSYPSGCLAVLIVTGVFLSSLPELYQVGLVVSGISMAGCVFVGDSRNRRASLGFAVTFFFGAILPFLPIPLIGVIVVLDSARKKSLGAVQAKNVYRISAISIVSMASVFGVLIWWWKVDGGIFHTRLPALAYEHPVALLVFVTMGSLVNAIFEEGLWRRNLFSHLNFVRRTIPRVFILGVLFGSVHYFALPGGWIGVVLTTLFSIAASWLVYLSGGRLGLAILAHWIADISLLALVVGVINA